MTPHILLIAQSGSLLCQHCCQLDPPPRDMPVERWIDHCRGFLLMHKHCEKPAEPSKQVQMFEDLAAREKALEPQHRVEVFAPTGADLQREYPLDFPCKAEGRNGRHEVYTTGDLIHCRACGGSQFNEPDPGIDASTSDPAPEIDPPSYCLTCGEDFADRGRHGHECEHDKPEIDDYAKFAEMYPMASDPMKLTDQVRRALGDKPEPGHLFDQLAKHHASSATFQLIGHWARVECAHLDSEARGVSGAIPGLTIPACLPFPEPLREMLGLKQPKKRGARPLTSGKRRATP